MTLKITIIGAIKEEEWKKVQDKAQDGKSQIECRAIRREKKFT